MRFLKVFLLLGLFGAGLMLIDAVFDEARKGAPIMVIGDRDKALAFQAKVEAGLKSDGAALEEAKRLRAGFSAELSAMLTVVYIWQAVFSVVLLIAATTLYLRFSPKKV